MSQSDAFYMALAIEQALKAFETGEVPVGAVLVYKGEVIATAHNQVENLKDATAHAEILCIKAAAAHLDNWRLKDSILYCTLEPCSMCAGALIASRVDTLVWGAPDIRQGAHGSWINLIDKQHPIHNLKVRSGVLEEECARLMVDFFKQRRMQNACSI